MNHFKQSGYTLKVLNLNSKCFVSKTAKSPTSTKTDVTLRTNIVKNIAKNYNSVPLLKFPLGRPKMLSNHAQIEKAHQKCYKEHLDDNPNYYPSITTILNQTMSAESLNALKRWETEKIK